jgi:hypothetical protein
VRGEISPVTSAASRSIGCSGNGICSTTRRRTHSGCATPICRASAICDAVSATPSRRITASCSSPHAQASGSNPDYSLRNHKKRCECLNENCASPDLVSNALPFGRLWYGGRDAAANAVSYAKFYSRSHHAVVRVYDETHKVIERTSRMAISKSRL